jgi:hypothetical protein
VKLPSIASGIGSAPSRIFLGLVLLTTLIVAIQQHQKAARSVSDGLGGHSNDFDRWMLMTPPLVRDHADYVNDQLPTGPITLLVLAPLSTLSRPNAQVAWVFAKLAFAYLAFGLAAALLARAGIRLTPKAVALIVAGWWLPVIVDMQEGQMNFVAFLPLIAGLLVAQRETARSQALAGLLVALAVAVKVTPVIFIVYFMWRRRWLLSAAALGGLALWLLVVPALAFGWEQNLRWLGQWARIMIFPYVTETKVVYSTTQSFGSLVLRLLTDVPAFETTRSGALTAHYMNLASLDDSTVQWIVRLALMGAGIGGLIWARRPLPTLASPRYVIEIGAVAAFMLWFSERTWTHHYISFLLTLAAGAMIVSRSRSGRSGRGVERAMMLFAATTFFASEAGYVFGLNGVDWVKATGVFLWSSMILAFVIVRHPLANEYQGLEASRDSATTTRRHDKNA